MFGTGISSGQENRYIVRPVDTQVALVNPMMGWTFQYYSNMIENYGSRIKPSDTLDDFPGLSVIYLRLPWSYIEPEEGVFNWSIVDAPAQRWIDKGLRIAFRFTCSESFMRYATPQWVEKAGAKGYNFKQGKILEDGPYWEPDFNDSVFLEKLEHFIKAAAERYDGNPNVDFIDIGSFGVWGEGHTGASTGLKYTPETVIKHIDIYTKYFKSTLIAANDDFAGLETTFEELVKENLSGDKSRQKSKSIEYALKKGLTLRDDSILVLAPPRQYFHEVMAQPFWPHLPVILECEHYGYSVKRGAWGDGSFYLKAVEDYHASYASIHWWPREFLSEQKDLINRMNLRLGYRLFPQEISLPASIGLDKPFTITAKWSNTGVAPCYPGGYVAFTLKDSEGGIVAVFVDEAFNVRTLEVGAAGNSPVQSVEKVFSCAANMKPGKFDIFLSVGKRDGTPVIALPLSGDDGHRRYKVGAVEVEKTE